LDLEAQGRTPEGDPEALSDDRSATEYYGGPREFSPITKNYGRPDRALSVKTLLSRREPSELASLQIYLRNKNYHAV